MAPKISPAKLKGMPWADFFYLLDNSPTRGLQSMYAKENGIPKSNISLYYQKHLADENFDPSVLIHGGSNRIFDDLEEDYMAAFLIDDLANTGVPMPDAEI